MFAKVTAHICGMWFYIISRILHWKIIFPNIDSPSDPRPSLKEGKNNYEEMCYCKIFLVFQPDILPQLSNRIESSRVLSLG